MQLRKDNLRRAGDGPKRILLVDDHPLVREAIGMLIGADPQQTVVVGEAGSAAEGMRLVAERHPDLVVLDVSLPGANGIEVCKDIRAQFPGVRVLVLSMHEEDLYAERALRAGAQGYVVKSEPGAVVVEAINRVLSGELYVSQALASRLLKQMVTSHTPDDHRSGVERLSDRELSVFADLGNGLSSAEIAAKLKLSIKTVQTYRQNIRHKLGLRHNSEVVRYATRWAMGEGRPAGTALPGSPFPG